jgi:hypothetical protein
MLSITTDGPSTAAVLVILGGLPISYESLSESLRSWWEKDVGGLSFQET